MENPKYKRVLLKISGEAFAGAATRGMYSLVLGEAKDVDRKSVV